VIVNQFDLMEPAIPVDEANPPLLIDPYRMLTGAVASQGVQPVAGRAAQVVKRCCGIDQPQLSQGRLCQFARNTLGHVFPEYRFSPPVPERFDHRATLTAQITHVKREYMATSHTDRNRQDVAIHNQGAVILSVAKDLLAGMRSTGK